MVISNTSTLGKNIKFLRKFYGETQEELGAIIGVEKNTICNYEKDERVPEKGIILAIANHFSIPMDLLVTGDFSHLGKIKIDTKAIYGGVYELLPILTTSEALSNWHFKLALQYHKEIYYGIKTNDERYFDNIDTCIDEYEKAFKELKIIPVVSANLLAIYYLLLDITDDTGAFDEHPSAFILQVKKSDPVLRNKIDFSDKEEVTEAFASAEDYRQEFIVKTLYYINILKRIEEWADLADYYIALQYIYNIGDNDFGRTLNGIIGAEMMKAFSIIGNTYAKKFLEFNSMIIGKSSQSENDNE